MELHKLYEKGYDWLFNYGPKIIVAVIVFFIGEWVIRLLQRRLRKRMQHKKYDSALRPFLQNLVFTVLQVLLFLLVMQIVGARLTIFTALVAAMGAAAALALSGTLQNFTSGILILALKPFNIGDNIIAQGQEGTVTSIRLFYSVITTYDNRTVVIPNSKLSNEVIVNVTCEGKRRLETELKFNFGVDFQHVKAIVEETVEKGGGVRTDVAPRVGVSAVEADGYKVRINVWLDAHGYEDEKMAFHEKLVARLKESDIKLPGKE
jgi:small conductance mechanosensitive channel